MQVPSRHSEQLSLDPAQSALVVQAVPQAGGVLQTPLTQAVQPFLAASPTHWSSLTQLEPQTGGFEQTLPVPVLFGIQEVQPSGAPKQ